MINLRDIGSIFAHWDAIQRIIASLALMMLSVVAEGEVPQDSASPDAARQPVAALR